MQAVVEHYQKTYELTHSLWQQRNRTFLILLAVIGGATLLTMQVATAQSLLVYWVAKLVGVTESSAVDELRKGFPFGLLQTILLIVVFYLMVTLYHRAIYVLRNFSYLERLEGEIREHLGLAEGTVAFTRESKFYWGCRPWLSGVIKWVYIVMLGALLVTFLRNQILADYRGGTWWLFIVDIAIATATLMFYLGYARASVHFERLTPSDAADQTAGAPATEPVPPRHAAGT